MIAAETAADPAQAPEAESTAALLASAAVLPLCSPVFYYKAARRGFGIAVLFLFIFATLVSVITAAGLVRGLSAASVGISQAFANGTFPEITIINGVAHVEGEQPIYILNQNRMLIAVDTTGRLTAIDRGHYDQGLLLTRTQLHALNERGEYQRRNLTDVQALFKANPLVINAESATRFWNGLTGILSIGGFAGAWFYNFVWRLILLMLFGSLLFALAKAMTNKATWSGVVTVGLYALVPAIYFGYLFTRANITFPLRGTLVWLAFWLFGLLSTYAGLVKPWQRLGGLRALAGIPLLLALTVDAVFRPANGTLVVWVVMGVTLAVLVGISLFSDGQSENSETPAAV